MGLTQTIMAKAMMNLIAFIGAAGLSLSAFEAGGACCGCDETQQPDGSEVW